MSEERSSPKFEGCQSIFHGQGMHKVQEAMHHGLHKIFPPFKKGSTSPRTTGTTCRDKISDRSTVFEFDMDHRDFRKPPLLRPPSQEFTVSSSSCASTAQLTRSSDGSSTNTLSTTAAPMTKTTNKYHNSKLHALLRAVGTRHLGSTCSVGSASRYTGNEWVNQDDDDDDESTLAYNASTSVLTGDHTDKDIIGAVTHGTAAGNDGSLVVISDPNLYISPKPGRDVSWVRSDDGKTMHLELNIRRRKDDGDKGEVGSTSLLRARCRPLERSPRVHQRRVGTGTAALSRSSQHGKVARRPSTSSSTTDWKRSKSEGRKLHGNSKNSDSNSNDVHTSRKKAHLRSRSSHAARRTTTRCHEKRVIKDQPTPSLLLSDSREKATYDKEKEDNHIVK